MSPDAMSCRTSRSSALRAFRGRGFQGRPEAVFEGLLAKTPLDLDLDYG